MQNLPEVIYLDKCLVVVNKPPGLLSIPDGHNPEKPYLKHVLEPEFGNLWIVHRLDKDTSGVIILARDENAHTHLNNQFSVRTVEKVYHTIVIGLPTWETVSVNSPLRANVGRRKRTIVDPIGGKNAITNFRVLERFENHAVVEALPKTGRTHQIRTHLYSIGHPVLADKMYGEDSETTIIGRLALHAVSIKIIHPETQRTCIFKAQFFEDFAQAVELL